MIKKVNSDFKVKIVYHGEDINNYKCDYWNWEWISYNQNITWKIIQNNPNKNWDWDELSSEILNILSLEIKAESSQISSVEEFIDMVERGSHSILSYKIL